MKAIIITTAVLFLLSSCKNEPIINLTDAKQRVKDYYESGEINDEIKKVIDKAITALNSVEISNRSVAVFDIDETTLSSYEYTESLDFGYSSDSWTEWQLKAVAKSIPEVKRIYDYLIKKNVNVIFLTGKRIDVYDATYKNLVNEGYTKFDTLICRQENEFELKADEYKTFHRNRFAEKGYNIIMCVGDQDSDLIGENTGIRVKIPNYLYKLN